MRDAIPTLNLAEWPINLSQFDSRPVSLGMLKAISPLEIAFRNWMREKLDGVFANCHAVPTDTFALALGESTRRDITKIGGLPYWPKSRPWPRGENGEPLRFMFQFRFVESKDLVGELPGDLLVVFFPMVKTFWSVSKVPDMFGFEDGAFSTWVKLSDEPIVTMEDAPSFSYKSLTAYGVRYRTEDYVAAPERLREVDRHVLANYRDAPWISRWFTNSLFIHPTLKVGGLPFNLYEGDFKPPGKFLCGVSNLQPDSDIEWPFVNRQVPLGSESDDEDLMLFEGDGLLKYNWYLGEDGEPICTYEYQLDLPLDENEPRN